MSSAPSSLVEAGASAIGASMGRTGGGSDAGGSNDGRGSGSNDGRGSEANDGRGSEANDGRGSEANDGRGSEANDGRGSEANDGSGSEGGDGRGSRFEGRQWVLGCPPDEGHVLGACAPFRRTGDALVDERRNDAALLRTRPRKVEKEAGQARAPRWRPDAGRTVATSACPRAERRLPPRSTRLLGRRAPTSSALSLWMSSAKKETFPGPACATSLGRASCNPTCRSPLVTTPRTASRPLMCTKHRRAGSRSRARRQNLSPPLPHP